MEHDLVEIARIVSPKGLKGKMWITPYGDCVERFCSYTHLIIGNQGISRRILSCTPHKDRCVIELEGVDDIDKAEAVKGETLFITGEQLKPLEEGEYYWKDLLGLKVMDQEGKELGAIIRIFPTGSNDVYVVNQDREYFIPATKDVIKEISLEKGVVVIDASLLEGLLD